VATASNSGALVAIVAAAKGMATVTVTASDPDGGSAEQNIEVTVPNRGPRPIGSIPPLTIHRGSPTTVEVSAYCDDPDGDVLSYEAAVSDEDGVAPL